MGNSVRAAPSSPVPAGPASLQLPPCAPGLLTPGRPEGPGSGSPPGSGRGSRDSVGGSSRAAVKGGGRRGLRAACARREQGGQEACWGGAWADAPAPGPRGEAGRGSSSFLHSLQEAVSGRVKFGGLRRRLAALAPSPTAPSPARRLDSTPAARPSLPYQSLGRPTTTPGAARFPSTPFSLPFTFLSACLVPPHSGFSSPHCISPFPC